MGVVWGFSVNIMECQKEWCGLYVLGEMYMVGFIGIIFG